LPYWEAVLKNSFLVLVREVNEEVRYGNKETADAKAESHYFDFGSPNLIFSINKPPY
jgi:hypothetical protein